MNRDDMTVNISLPLFGLLFVIGPVLARADCPCPAVPGVDQAASGATAIFEGTVQEHNLRPDGGQQVHFAVVRSFKGEVGETQQVRIPASLVDCGQSFAPHQSYLVYAGGTSQALSLAPCSRTRPTEEAADDLQHLGPGVVPVDAPTSDGVSASPKKSRLQPHPGGSGCAGCAVGSRRAPDSGTERFAHSPWLPLLLGATLGLLLRRQQRQRR